MKALIVGLGIGSLYERAAKSLEWEVETVDINPALNPTHTSIPQVDKDHYDIGIVCTPNYLHKETLDALLPICKLVLVEKPGLKNLDEWNYYTENFPGRVFMIKNNCFRSIFYGMGLNLENIAAISIEWVNKDRVPKPGSWFTNKDLAYGGVSRDLLPHLLQIAIALVRYDVDNLKLLEGHIEQRYTLDDIDISSYGTKVIDGVYNVDDQCQVGLLYKDMLPISCTAAWKTDKEESVKWIIHLYDGTQIVYEAGLCPEEAYITMLKSFETPQHASNIAIHQKMDEFVHTVIDKL